MPSVCKWLEFHVGKKSGSCWQELLLFSVDCFCFVTVLFICLSFLRVVRTRYRLPVCYLLCLCCYKRESRESATRASSLPTRAIGKKTDTSAQPLIADTRTAVRQSYLTTTDCAEVSDSSGKPKKSSRNLGKLLDDDSGVSHLKPSQSDSTSSKPKAMVSSSIAVGKPKVKTVKSKRIITAIRSRPQTEACVRRRASTTSVSLATMSGSNEPIVLSLALICVLIALFFSAFVVFYDVLMFFVFDRSLTCVWQQLAMCTLIAMRLAVYVSFMLRLSAVLSTYVSLFPDTNFNSQPMAVTSTTTTIASTKLLLSPTKTLSSISSVAMAGTMVYKHNDKKGKGALMLYPKWLMAALIFVPMAAYMISIAYSLVFIFVLHFRRYARKKRCAVQSLLTAFWLPLAVDTSMFMLLLVCANERLRTFIARILLKPETLLQSGHWLKIRPILQQMIKLNVVVWALALLTVLTTGAALLIGSFDRGVAVRCTGAALMCLVSVVCVLSPFESYGAEYHYCCFACHKMGFHICFFHVLKKARRQLASSNAFDGRYDEINDTLRTSGATPRRNRQLEEGRVKKKQSKKKRQADIGEDEEMCFSVETLKKPSVSACSSSGVTVKGGLHTDRKRRRKRRRRGPRGSEHTVPSKTSLSTIGSELALSGNSTTFTYRRFDSDRCADTCMLGDDNDLSMAASTSSSGSSSESFSSSLPQPRRFQVTRDRKPLTDD